MKMKWSSPKSCQGIYHRTNLSKAALIPPSSSYSDFVSTLLSKSASLLNSFIPCHAARLGSGPLYVCGAQSLTPSLQSDGRNFSRSLTTRSLNPRILVLPPANMMLEYSYRRKAGGHFSIVWTMASGMPAWLMPISDGLNRTSGTANLSFVILTTCWSSLSYSSTPLT